MESNTKAMSEEKKQFEALGYYIGNGDDRMRNLELVEAELQALGYKPWIHMRPEERVRQYNCYVIAYSDGEYILSGSNRGEEFASRPIPTKLMESYTHDTSERTIATNETTYDHINPSHYQQFSIETIDMMVAIWGNEKVAAHCEMCAFKYRMRMGEKPDQPIERDMGKVQWYLNKAKELRG